MKTPNMTEPTPPSAALWQQQSRDLLASLKATAQLDVASIGGQAAAPQGGTEAYRIARAPITIFERELIELYGKWQKRVTDRAGDEEELTDPYEICGEQMLAIVSRHHGTHDPTAELRARVAELEAERDEARAQFEQYAGWSRWREGLWRITHPASGHSAEWVAEPDAALSASSQQEGGKPQEKCIRCRRNIAMDYPQANGLCEDCNHEARAERNESYPI